MDFKNIIKELVIGKKIRRKHWHRDFFLKLGIKDSIIDCFGNPFSFKLTSFSGKDWEIFEEKPKVIILDDNELSILKYAEEFPKNWARICRGLDKKKGEKIE